MDEEALFYLRSRGLDESAARRLLVRGFVDEVISAIEDEPFRAHAEELAMGMLQEL
jgi:Fe-S cluster assembly protein SufD